MVWMETSTEDCFQHSITTETMTGTTAHALSTLVGGTIHVTMETPTDRIVNRDQRGIKMRWTTWLSLTTLMKVYCPQNSCSDKYPWQIACPWYLKNYWQIKRPYFDLLVIAFFNVIEVFSLFIYLLKIMFQNLEHQMWFSNCKFESVN